MRIAVMGTGYVGLVTGATLAASGHDVVCRDIRPGRVAALNTGGCRIFEPGLPELLAAGLASGKLHGSGKVADEISAGDLTFICVGTPSRDDGSTWSKPLLHLHAGPGRYSGNQPRAEAHAAGSGTRLQDAPLK